MTFNKYYLPHLLYLRFNRMTVMRLRIALLGLALVASVASASAQDVIKGDNKDKEKTKVTKPSRDFLMLELMYNGWYNAPDSINTTGIGRGFNMYLCYDFPIGKKAETHFSFAAGVGISSSNIYFKDQEIVLDDLVDSTSQARFIPESRNYKKYKLTTTYLEAPFELRFFANKYNRNKGFKAAVGMRVGTLLGAGTKGKEDGTKIVYKVNSKRYIETWRFSTSVRFGYGNFNLIGTYNLTNLYKEGQGPVVTPYSIGFSITGL